MHHVNSPFASQRRLRRWFVALVILASVLPAAAQTTSSADEAGGVRPEEEAELSPPTGVLTLADALAAALRASPSLPASALELRALEAEALQAGYLPNPTFTTEVEDFAGSGERGGFDVSETTLSLSQLIELGGKRATRVRLARAERDLSRWDYEVRRVDVLTSVATAFFETLAAQERLALAGELLRTAEETLRSVAATVRSGAVSPIEEGRAQVSLSQVRIERESRVRSLEEAKLALAQTWGGTEAVFSEVRGDFPAVSPPEGLEDFLARIEANPDLARWTTELEARAAALSLEKARAVPDVTVSAGGRYYRDGQDVGLVALFSLPLPLFDRNQGAIGAAEMRLARARSEQRAAEVSTRGAVARSYQALLAAYRRAVELRDGALPQAKTVFDGTRTGYVRGLFSYIEVLDAQRTLFQLRGEYVDALADYHASLAALSRLTGDLPYGSDAGRESP
jgi:cobalt-zinc-cadmium efflux system outer membrane protein